MIVRLLGLCPRQGCGEAAAALRASAAVAALLAGACGHAAPEPPAPGPPMTAAERLEYRRHVGVTLVKVTPLTVPAGRPPVVRVFADVSNRGDRELGTVHLVVSFRGNAGRGAHEENWFPVLVGANYLDVTNTPLAPNETRRFDADFNIASDLAANVDVRVEAVTPVVATQLLR
jgi:hypothetical protein